jgi:hypothetical protein
MQPKISQEEYHLKLLELLELIVGKKVKNLNILSISHYIDNKSGKNKRHMQMISL